MLDMPRQCGTPRVGLSFTSREGPSYGRISPVPTNGDLGRKEPQSWKPFLFHVYLCYVNNYLVQSLEGEYQRASLSKRIDG